MGKKVSFKIATNGVEGPVRQTELALRQTAEENKDWAIPDSEKDPLGELKDKDESTNVEKGKVAKTRVENERLDPTDTPKAEGQSQNESTKTIDLKHGGDDHPSPKSYTRGEASHKTPDEGSHNTGHPTELINEHKPTNTVLKRSRRARRSAKFYQPGLDNVNYTYVGEPSSYEEAIASPDVEPWLQSMKSEVDLIHQN